MLDASWLVILLPLLLAALLLAGEPRRRQWSLDHSPCPGCGVALSGDDFGDGACGNGLVYCARCKGLARCGC